MVVDLDIYRTANLLIKQHGTDDAKYHASQRSGEMLIEGNLDGLRAWTQILKAIDELSTNARPHDVASH